MSEVVETPEVLDAEEEAAFDSAFNETRGNDEPAEKHNAATVPVVASAADSKPVADAKNPAPDATPTASESQQQEQPATPAVQPRLIGGLTEEQVAAALAKLGTMQQTIDKLAGRNGQLAQEIQRMRENPPQTTAQQVQLDLKLEKLSADYPELAKLLAEDLKAGFSAPVGTAAASAPGNAPQQGFTQEQVQAMLQEQEHRMRDHLEVRALSLVHPDWNHVIRTQEFANFRDHVLPPGEGKKLMESEDSAYISLRLTQFKQWANQMFQQQQAQQQATAQAAQQQQATQRRAAAAVLPKARAATPQQSATISEEDAFMQSFNAERQRTGRAA